MPDGGECGPVCRAPISVRVQQRACVGLHLHDSQPQIRRDLPHGARHTLTQRPVVERHVIAVHEDEVRDLVPMLEQRIERVHAAGEETPDTVSSADGRFLNLA
jgi:hypothetical protein